MKLFSRLWVSHQSIHTIVLMAVFKSSTLLSLPFYSAWTIKVLHDVLWILVIVHLLNSGCGRGWCTHTAREREIAFPQCQWGIIILHMHIVIPSDWKITVSPYTLDPITQFLVDRNPISIFMLIQVSVCVCVCGSEAFFLDVCFFFQLQILAKTFTGFKYSYIQNGSCLLRFTGRHVLLALDIFIFFLHEIGWCVNEICSKCIVLSVHMAFPNNFKLVILCHTWTCSRHLSTDIFHLCEVI